MARHVGLLGVEEARSPAHDLDMDAVELRSDGGSRKARGPVRAARDASSIGCGRLTRWGRRRTWTQGSPREHCRHREDTESHHSGDGPARSTTRMMAPMPRRRGRMRCGLTRVDERRSALKSLPDLILEVHRSSSCLRVCKALWVWLFTVPMETPRRSAVSRSE